MNSQEYKVAESQYAEFIKKIRAIQKDVNKQFKQDGREQVFNIRNIQYKLDPINESVHKRVLATITEFGKDEQELQNFAQFVKELKMARARHQMKYTKSCQDIEKFIEDYMTLYYNKYFRVISGRAVGTTLYYYDYNDPSEYERKLNRAADYSLPIILLPDGKAYFSATCHKDLCGYLTAENIDVSGAARIFISPRNHMFTMTSMWNYGYTENSTEDANPTLTKEQAEAIAKIYKDLQAKWATINPMNKIVQHSNFFGGVIQSDLAKENLKTLERAFEYDEFSVRDYNKYLNRQLRGEEFGDFN